MLILVVADLYEAVKIPSHPLKMMVIVIRCTVMNSMQPLSVIVLAVAVIHEAVKTKSYLLKVVVGHPGARTLLQYG